MLQELGQLNQYLTKRKQKRHASKGKQDPNATASFNNCSSRTSKAYKDTNRKEELKTNEEVEYMSDYAKNYSRSIRSGNSPRKNSRDKEN